MNQHERDQLSHLASDWDARAAQLERGLRTLSGDEQAQLLRACAGQLRDRLLQLRSPAPRVLGGEVNLISWGPDLYPPERSEHDG